MESAKLKQKLLTDNGCFVNQGSNQSLLQNHCKCFSKTNSKDIDKISLNKNQMLIKFQCQGKEMKEEDFSARKL